MVINAYARLCKEYYVKDARAIIRSPHDKFIGSVLQVWHDADVTLYNLPVRISNKHSWFGLETKHMFVQAWYDFAHWLFATKSHDFDEMHNCVSWDIDDTDFFMHQLIRAMSITVWYMMSPGILDLPSNKGRNGDLLKLLKN